MEIVFIVLLIGGVVIYLLPAFVAFFRDVRQKVPILILNLLLGWLLIPWVIALVWASMNESRPFDDWDEEDD